MNLDSVYKQIWVLYLSWTIVHGRRLSSDNCPYYMDNVHVTWTWSKYVWSKFSYKLAMYYGQFFGKIVHEILSLSIKYGKCPWNNALVHKIWTLSMKYGQSRKKLFCPWTVDVHWQLSTKRTRPTNFILNN